MSRFVIPSLMKAAQQNGYGNVRDVLTVAENISVPRELSAKQILVRVCAASMNPADWKLLYGNISMLNLLRFPHIPGCDAAGVVVDVGSEVKRFQIGDKVYGNVGMYGGAYAEYVRANENVFALKPKNLTMEEAAGVPLACETSYQALFNKVSPPIGPNSKVFICGASSATGIFAVQLAKAVGATVAATCSKRNFFLMEKLGYRIVENKSDETTDDKDLFLIDYNQRDFGEELRGENFDVVYDCVGGQEQWKSAQLILKSGGYFVTNIGDDKESVLSLKYIFNLGTSLINRKFWSIFGSNHHQYILHLMKQNPADFDDLITNYFENNKVKVLIDTTCDWRKDGVESLFHLYEKSRSGKAKGKLILKITDED